MNYLRQKNAIGAAAVALAAYGFLAPAIACEIEDWSYQDKAGKLYISGATTCREGRLTLRVYDDSNDKFLASDFTYIKGYAFQMYLDARVPSRVSIKYAVD